MQASLSFDQAPPISVPYRFFVLAPWFGVIAGILLAWSGEEALASRWTPQALALTHLLALGFMLQAMCGALFQFIPVAVGGNVWRSNLVAGIVQPLLVLATLLLVAGLWWSSPALLAPAVPLFLLAGGGFVAVVSLALWRTPATGATLAALRIALAGLAITVLLGALLTEALARGLALPLLELTSVHLVWGLGGWAVLLLAGVSYYVVPMFQLTQPYPVWFARWFGPLLTVALLVWSGLVFVDDGRWSRLPALLALLLVAAFAGVTLWLQQTRRRKVQDATAACFRVAMLFTLGFAVMAMALLLSAEVENDPRSQVGLGVVALAGVFVSVIAGMLYKIVPFINWLFLQRLGAPLSAVPNMNKMIPADAMTGQLRLHVLAVLLLLAAVWQPGLTRLAGVAFAASCAWLGWNLAAAVWRYRSFRDQILLAVSRH